MQQIAVCSSTGPRPYQCDKQGGYTLFVNLDVSLHWSNHLQEVLVPLMISQEADITMLWWYCKMGFASPVTGSSSWEGVTDHR